MEPFKESYITPKKKKKSLNRSSVSTVQELGEHLESKPNADEDGPSTAY
jgi:hypothetical protein